MIRVKPSSFSIPSAFILMISIVISSSGCAGLARMLDDKDDSLTELERQKNDAIKAMLEERHVPRTRDQLKNLHGLEILNAKWLVQRGDYPGARTSYQRALKAKPDSIEAMIGIAHLLQLEGEIVKADQAYKKILTKHPDSAVAHHAVGTFYLSEKRWSEALPLFRIASKKEPRNSRYHYDLGIALAKNGQTELAVSEMAHSVGDAEAYFNIGYLLDQDGKKAEAQQLISMALARKPNLMPAREWIEKTAGKKNQLPKRGMQMGEERIFPVKGETTYYHPNPRVLQAVAQGNMKLKTPELQNNSQNQLPVIQSNNAGFSRNNTPQKTTINPMHSATKIPTGLTPQQLEQRKNQLSH